MLSYRPAATLAHGLDARSKLLFQVGFAIAAFGAATPGEAALLTAVAAAVLAAARLSPLPVVSALRVPLVILAVPPLAAAIVFEPPWIAPARAVDPLLASYRIALVFAVGSAYVRSTPIRDSRAAIQRHVPGRPGQILGVGVALVLRFFPLLLADIDRVRAAMTARLGERRSLRDRARRIALLGLRRAFLRADRLALALRARCFSWNPTPPELRFARRDYPVAAAGLALAVWPLV